MAAVVSGWRDLPQAGDEVLQGTESEVKRAISNRIRKAQMEASLTDLEAQTSNEHGRRRSRSPAAIADSYCLGLAMETTTVRITVQGGGLPEA